MVVTFPGATLSSIDGAQGPTVVSAVPQRIHSINAVNDGDYPVYVQLFNASLLSQVTLGVTVPTDEIMVGPADWSSSGPSVVSGKEGKVYSSGPPIYGRGIVIAVTRSRKGTDLAFAGDVRVSMTTVAS